MSAIAKDNSFLLLQKIHQDIHDDDKTKLHGSAGDDICDDDRGLILDPYFTFENQKMLAYSVIALAVIAVIVFILRGSITNYNFYSSDSGFPNSTIFLGGSTICILFVTYVAYSYNIAYNEYRKWVFWAYFIYVITYPLWVLNLSLRLEYYVKGQPVESNGTTFLVVSTISILVIFAFVGCKSMVLSMFIFASLLWNLYITYQWWFKERSISDRHNS